MLYSKLYQSVKYALSFRDNTLMLIFLKNRETVNTH